MAKQNSDEMSMWEHIEALRPHLVRSVCAVFVFFVLAFICKGFIVDGILMGPQSADFPTNRLLNSFVERWGIEGLAVNATTYDFINTSVAGQFNMHMRLALIVALVLSVPWLLWEIWLYVRPALTQSERKACRGFVFWSCLCLGAGVLFGYYVMSPLALNFLLNYQLSPSFENMIDIGSYFSTVTSSVLACGGVFTLPLVIYFLARMGIVSASFLRRYRKHAFFVLACFSAIITPPDIFSMTLVLLPLYLLYELGISIAKRVNG